MLASFCKANNLSITNTHFQHHPRRRYTWISPGDRARNQIDYIMIDKDWMSSITNARTRPGVDCDGDHILVTANLRMKVYMNAKKECAVKYDLDKLDQDDEVKQQYTIHTENRFSALLTDWTANETMPNEIWADYSKVLKEEAETRIGLRKNKPKKPYISDEVFQLAKEKSDARTRNEAEYKRLKKEVRQKIRRDKKAWLEYECFQITQENFR